MFIAKVVGNVVVTQKNPKLQGMKLLLIQPCIYKDHKLHASESSLVAVDSIGAEIGECVLFTEGSAGLTPGRADSPVDAVIIAAVDTVEVDGTTVETPRQANLDSPEARLFYSEEAERIKAEIIAVGRKLWSRMYVDGNGGNISHRIGPNAVICTPTLVSKADLKPEDLCLVDLDGNQILGSKPRTSEIFLHLEIYKAVPEARAAVHCHPPHATAYAITGRVPPTRIIPEYEVFVGQVAVAPYETPGTPEFAQTVLPFVKQHNTVLLSNHGIVCWADSVTHAEWYTEVVDTYCWTLMLAAQLGAPLAYIPPEKASDLRAIRKRLGLPDVRSDRRNFKQQ